MAGKRKPSALRLLRAQESSAVLDALLKAHPDLVAEAETLAAGMLDDTTRESVAEQVEHALRSLPLETLGQRAGYHPGRGYTHEGDAAAEIVEETLAPYLDDITRRLTVGLTTPAYQVAAGVLAGLHACDGEHGGDEVLGYAGDVDNYTYSVFALLDKHQAGLPEDLLHEACPNGPTCTTGSCQEGRPHSQDRRRARPTDFSTAVRRAEAARATSTGTIA